MRTRVTELLGIRYPIIEGGLVHVGNPELAAAVSNAGGLGAIAAGGKAKEALTQEIRLTKSLTDKPFGVNIPIGYRQDLTLAQVETVLEEKVAVVATSAGNPAAYTDRLHQAGIKVMHVVSTVRQAMKAEAVGVDIVITEGFEAGGHNGSDELTTMVLVPQVVDAVSIPVVAAGGIADARGFLAALALGAEGIQMGTRFVATRECIAHSSYKEAIVNSEDTSTLILERSIGRVNRVLDCPYARKVLEVEADGISKDELLPYISGKANRKAALEGAWDAGFAYAGQVSGLTKEILSAKEVIDHIMQEASAVRARLDGLDLP